jgi:hypothetical protein
MAVRTRKKLGKVRGSRTKAQLLTPLTIWMKLHVVNSFWTSSFSFLLHSQVGHGDVRNLRSGRPTRSYCQKLHLTVK